MSTEPTQIFEDLRQLCVQYAKEVPRKRKPWPESIRSRVLRLRFLGVSNHRIAQETGIPVMTLYSWKMPAAEQARALPEASGDERVGGFLPVQVVKRRSGLPAPRVRRRPSRRTSTVTVKSRGLEDRTLSVTVVHPSGIRLEGLTFAQAIEAARRLPR